MLQLSIRHLEPETRFPYAVTSLRLGAVPLFEILSKTGPVLTVRMNEETAIYAWQVRLWARDPRKLYGILFGCALAALIGWLFFRQIVVAMVGFVAIAAATADYWMPQKYKLDENGATARCGLSVSAIAWDDVKRIIPDEEGVKLSPLAADGKLSPFRGVYLRFAENRDEVIKRIEARCSKNV